MQSTQPEAHWDAILGDLVPGEVRCLFAASVVDALETQHRGAANRLSVTPTVVLTWSNAPRIDLAIREIASQFATATSAAWLQRQQANPATANLATSANDSPAMVVDETAGQFFPHDPRWFRKVCNLIYAGKPPLPDGYPLAESIRRLASCWSTDPITCLLAVGDQADRNETHLDGLCRGAQWVAQQTAGRVALLLPARFRGDPALASVDFDAVTISDSPSENDQLDWLRHSSSSNRRTDVEQKNRFWPLLGNPHPFSPGEQRLASCLQEDAELRGRFSFNTVIETGSQRRYIVDLLDRELRLVVEVDGYCHHASKVAFSADRERDFHLTVDGYLVLRIPHHEIIDDVEHALEKIRTLVRFRQGKLS